MAIPVIGLAGPGVGQHRMDQRPHTSRLEETARENATASLVNSGARIGSSRPVAVARSHLEAHVSHSAKTGQASEGSVGIGGALWIAEPMGQK